MAMKLEDIDFLDHPLDTRHAIDSITETLKTARKNVKIFAGEAHWAIFDHPDIIDTLTDLRKQGVNIKVVVGPVISTGGAPNSPELVDIAKKGILELYYRSKRGSDPHFMIIDDSVAFVEEKGHPPLLLLRDRTSRKVERSSSPLEFAKYLAKFNKASTKKNFVANPNERYIFLRSFDIRRAMKIANERGKNYDSLTATEIKELIGDQLLRT